MRLKRTAKYFAICAACLCLLVAAGIVVLHTAPVKRFVLTRVEQLLAGHNLVFRASDLDYNLLALTIRLRNVEVRSATAAELPPLARLREVMVELSVPALLRGKIDLRNGQIFGAELQLFVDERGRDNIPRLPEQKQEGQTQWLVRHLSITDAAFRYQDRRQKLDLLLPVWLTMSGAPLTGEHTIRLQTVKSGRVKLEGRQLELRSLQAELVLERNALALRRLQLQTPDATLALSGRMNDLKNPVFDLSAETTLQLASLAQFAGLQQPLTGNLRAHLQARGPLGRLRADVQLEGKDLVFRNFDRTELNATLQYDAGRRRMDIVALRLDSPQGRLQARASLALESSAGDSELKAVLRDVDLERLARAARLPARLASSLSGSADLSWPGLAYERARGSCELRLTALHSQVTENTLPVKGVLRGRFTPQQVFIHVDAVAAAGALANGHLQLVNRRQLAGHLDLAVPNVAEVLSALERFQGEKPGSLSASRVSGPATLTVQLAGTVNQPSALVSVQSDHLSAAQLKDLQLRAELDVSPKALRIQQAWLSWRQQRVTLSGTADFRGRSPGLNFNLQVQNASIADLLAGLGRPDAKADGRLTVVAQLRGTARRPVVQADLQGADLVAFGEPLGQLAAQVETANEQILLRRLELLRPNGESLAAAGTYDLTHRSLSLQADSEKFTLQSLELPTGLPVRGTLSFRLQASGSIENPAGSLTFLGSHLRVRDQEVGEVGLRVKVSDRHLALQLDAPKYDLVGQLTSAIDRPYLAQFQAQTTHLDLGTLGLGERTPQGKLSAKIEGQGPLGDWRKIEAQAEIAQFDLTYNNEPIRSQGPIRAMFRDGLLSVEQATVVAAGSSVHVTGTLPLERQAPAGDLRVQADLDLERLARFLPPERKLTLAGRGSLDLHLRGTLDRIDPDGFLLFKGAYVDAPMFRLAITNIDLSARVGHGQLQLQYARANYGPAALELSGEAPLRVLPHLPVQLPQGSGPARFFAKLQEIELASLPNVPEQISGTVSMELQGAAEQADLRHLQAKLTFPTLRLQLGDIPLEQQGVSAITLAKGVARVERLQLTGPETKIALSGHAGLSAPQTLALNVSGSFNAALLGAFTDRLRAAGDTRVEVSVRGTTGQPDLSGFVTVTGGQLALNNPRFSADSIDLRIDLQGRRIVLSRLSGSLNGGDLTGGGSIRLGAGTIQDADLKFTARSVFLNFPAGLRTLSDIRLTVSTLGEAFIVGGQVWVLEGSYTTDVNLDTGLMAYLERQPELDVTAERNPLLQRIRYNIAVESRNPLLIDNNVARLGVNLALRIVGDYYSPGLLGRMTVEEGGRVRLQERDYLVERMVVTFTSERRIEPTIDLLARTTVADHEITMNIFGEPGRRTQTTLTSDPPLPETDILALLLTGRKLDEVRGREFDIAQTQVLSYLTGRVGSTLGRGVESATGLSLVRIEPSLIANEDDPTARLTVGQDITRKLSFIYSMNLRDSGDQIWVAEYDLTRRFITRAVKQQDNSYRLDFRHDIRFGGRPPPPTSTSERERKRIGTVDFTNPQIFSEKRLLDTFGVKPGKPYDFFRVRKGLDQLEKLYMKEGYLESRLNLDRKLQNGAVDLSIHVRPGPKVEFVYEGWEIKDSTRDRVARMWHSGVFDTQRVEDAIRAIREELIQEGRYQSKIEHEITEPTPGVKRVLFDITPGPRFADAAVEFPGAQQIRADQLRKLIDKQKLWQEVWLSPDKVREVLTAFYREQGYLDVRVASPEYKFDPDAGRARAIFAMEEGPQFRVAEVAFEGNSAYEEGALRAAIPLKPGDPYRPELREASLRRLQELYWDKAYNDAEFAYSLDRRGPGELAVRFRIHEGKQSVVHDIEIFGRHHTSEHLVRSQLELQPGDLLILEKLSRSRRNLYSTGAYSLVNIDREPVTEAPATSILPVRLIVAVREIQPFELRYGGYFDTERGPGGILDFSNRNMLGSARVLGLRTRYDSDLREARLYFSQPLLKRFPVRSTANVFGRREIRDLFLTDRLGLGLNQEARWKDRYVFNWGYRFSRDATYDREPDPIFGPLPPIRTRVAALNATLTLENRDDFLDATRGQFLSQSFEWGPELLGSQLRYIRYFGQYFHYVPLAEPMEIPWQKGRRRTRLVYAGGIRLGLARGLGGQVIIPSQRFFAGGGTTVRGFRQDGLGPKDFRGNPLGGDAMLVINNELRFPLFHIFDGVGFVDAGNVFRDISNFRLSDIRRTGGGGLRIRTPYFLLRFDYGLKLDRKPGESRGQFFFSIGQAF